MTATHVRHCRRPLGDRRLRRVALGLCALLSGAVTAAAAEDLSAGRAIAETKCSRCHAVGSSGMSPLASAPQFRTLHERYPIESIEEALAEGIFVGHSPMPVFKLSSQEVVELVGYMKSLRSSPD
jgi:mono/diheme cytochrome c family protein